MKKVAIYARVSTLLGQSPQNQLIHLRDYAKQRQFEVVDEYVDQGISGAKERRPALDRLLEDAQQSKYSLILISALDRISRDTRHLLNLLHTLSQNQITIVSLRENLDFSTPVGMAFLSVCGAISSLERDLCRERIRNALAAKKLAAERNNTNWRCGRPLRVTSQIQQEVINLRNDGLTISAIAKRLDGRLSRSAIGTIVKCHPKNQVKNAKLTKSKNDLVNGQ